MQDRAWEFVNFIANGENQKMRAPFNSPTLKSLYENREMLEAMTGIA